MLWAVSRTLIKKTITISGEHQCLQHHTSEVMLPPGYDLELSVCIQVIFLGQDTLALPNQGTEAQQQVPVSLLSYLLHLTAIWRSILEELQKYPPPN